MGYRGNIPVAEKRKPKRVARKPRPQRVGERRDLIQRKKEAEAPTLQFRPNRNQLAALRVYLADPESFPSNRKLAEAIGMTGMAVGRWFHDAGFVRWWNTECLAYARATEGPALLELWRMAKNSELDRDQIMALTRFLERLEKLPPETQTAEGFLVALMAQAGDDRAIEAAFRDGATSREIEILVHAKAKREKADAFLARGAELGLVEGGNIDTPAGMAGHVAMSFLEERTQDVVDAEIVEEESDASPYSASDVASDNGHSVALDEGEGGSESREAPPRGVSHPTRPRGPRASRIPGRRPSVADEIEDRHREVLAPYVDCPHGQRCGECIRCGWLRMETGAGSCEEALEAMRLRRQEEESCG